MVKVDVDLRGLVTKNARLRERDLKFVGVLALNETMKFTRTKLGEEMQRAFDRPTYYTLNSMLVQHATKTKLFASVYVRKDGMGKTGNSPENFLTPQVYGGGRKFKRFERALRAASVLPAGWYVVPGPYARIDQFGNIDRGQIIQLLSYFKAFREQGFRGNATDQSIARIWKRGHSGKVATFGRRYFALQRPRGKLGPGIYMVERNTGSQRLEVPRPVWLFVRSVRYRPRWQFYRVAEGVVRMRFPLEWKRAVAKVLSLNAQRGWT